MSTTKTHILKTWPIYFKEIASGQKTFEVRVNDRNFKQGDIVVFHEYDPDAELYTGRTIVKQIGYILNKDNPFIHLGDVVIFSIL